MKNEELRELIEELKETIRHGTKPNSITLRAAAAKVLLDIFEGR